MSVLESLHSALNHLEEAREQAGTGTGLMITQIINEVNDLIDRTENIEERRNE